MAVDCGRKNPAGTMVALSAEVELPTGALKHWYPGAHAKSHVVLTKCSGHAHEKASRLGVHARPYWHGSGEQCEETSTAIAGAMVEVMVHAVSEVTSLMPV